MKKFFVFVSLLILCVMNVFGEIPDNVIISDNKSVEYEVVDNEKLKVIISIDGVKYSEILFYAFYQDGNCIEIPVPKYLCVYKDSIILSQGNGTSYRNIIVYQRKKEKIIKHSFENSLTMSTLPRTFEKYMIIYNQNPVLILHNQDNTLFYTVKKKVEKEISKIVIDSTKIILFFVDNDLEEILIEFYDNTNFEAGGYTLYRTDGIGLHSLIQKNGVKRPLRIGMARTTIYCSKDFRTMGDLDDSLHHLQ